MDYRRNVALDLVLTILLCGLWNLVVQYQQTKMLNALLKEERFVYWKMGVYSLLTCGIYFIYYEYKKTEALHEILGKTDESDGVLAVILSIVGFNWVWDAIFQTKINAYLDQQAKLPSSPK